jgi:hypothetical protein
MHEGLASCRIKQGDVIWHVPYTKMSFVGREEMDAREIIGRAHPLGNANGVGEAATWKKSPWGLSLWSYGTEEEIYVDLATMFTLRNPADPQEEFGNGTQEEKEKPESSRWEQAEALRKAREEQELKQKRAKAAEKERAEHARRRRAAEQRQIKFLHQARLQDRIKALTSLAEGAEVNMAQIDGFEKKWAEKDAAAAAAAQKADSPEEIFRQNPGAAALFASFPAAWQPMLRASQVYSNQVAEARRIEGRQRLCGRGRGGI